MRSNLSRNANINVLKEIGYVTLLITFFAGIILGSIKFKTVSATEFDEYRISFEENIIKQDEIPKDTIIKNNLINDIKIVLIFWIIGLSVVGVIVLFGYIAFKGFSLGYTISAIIRLFGLVDGNKYIFQNLFFKNVILILILIFMANFSVKIAKNFFSNKNNIKIDLIKYSFITICACFLLIIFYIFKLFF